MGIPHTGAPRLSRGPRRSLRGRCIALILTIFLTFLTRSVTQGTRGHSLGWSWVKVGRKIFYNYPFRRAVPPPPPRATREAAPRPTSLLSRIPTDHQYYPFEVMYPGSGTNPRSGANYTGKRRVEGQGREEVGGKEAVESEGDKTRSSPHIARYNLLIKQAGNQMRWCQALNILEDMLDSGLTPDLYTYNTALRALVHVPSRKGGGGGERGEKRGRSSALEWVVKEMEKRGVAGNEITCSLLMQGAKSDWREAEKIVSELRNKKLRLNTVLYSQLISIHSTARRWRTAFDYFQDMESTSVRTNPITFSSLIKGLSRAGKWETALQMHTLSESKGVPVDVVTLNTILDACRRSRKWKQALSFLFNSPRRLSQANLVSFNTLIGACQNVDQAFRTFGRALEMNIKPDTITYNTLMHACALRGQWERAVWAQRHMQQTGIRGDIHTYNTILNAFKTAGQWRRAVGMIGYMESVGVRSDIISFNSAMAACAKAGEDGVAVRLFQQMAWDGIRRDTGSFSTLIGAAGQAYKWKTALGLFEAMKVHGVVRNTVSYNTLINAYGKGLQWAKALEAYREMHQARVRTDEFTFSSVVNALAFSHQWQPAVGIYLDMKKSGIKLKAPMLTPFLKLYSHLDHQSALALSREMDNLSLESKRLQYIQKSESLDHAELRGFDEMGRNHFSGDEGSWDVSVCDDSEEDETRV
ncbi:hypothetical protein AAMO2058_001219800 [Amorphochlora amoebiformis]